LSRQHTELYETLKTRKKETDQCLDMQKFRREAEQAEQWMAMRDQLLNSEDFGVSNMYINTCVIEMKFLFILLSMIVLM